MSGNSWFSGLMAPISSIFDISILYSKNVLGQAITFMVAYLQCLQDLSGATCLLHTACFFLASQLTAVSLNT